MKNQTIMGDGINRHSILDSGSGSDAGERRSVSDASTISYSVTSYRWLVLLSVFLLNLVNAAFWLTYSPISDAVATHYGVSTNVVNMLSLCLSGLYGPVVWGAAPIVKVRPINASSSHTHHPPFFFFSPTEDRFRLVCAPRRRAHRCRWHRPLLRKGP